MGPGGDSLTQWAGPWVGLGIGAGPGKSERGIGEKFRSGS